MHRCLAHLTFLALLVPACVDDALVPCGELLCAAGAVCTPNGCATATQVEACHGLAESEACVAGGIGGACAGGACLPSLCGDGVQLLDELCDDGNTTSGDGCSRDCRSREQCGDGVVDLAIGEACDDAIVGISRDGCSSTCAAELLLWREVTSGDVEKAEFARIVPSHSTVLRIGHQGRAFDPSLTAHIEWTSSTWLQRPRDTGLPLRLDPTVAYDTRRRVVVVFGGRMLTDEVFGNTWEFDGATWQERATPIAPPPRASAAMAYDPARGIAVLHGGYLTRPGQSPEALADTWGWDGHDWIELAPAPRNGCGISAPCARGQAAMAYSPRHGGVMLFGGLDEVHEPLTDAWIWRGDRWEPLAVPAIDSIGRPKLAAAPNGDLVLSEATATYVNTAAGWSTLELPVPAPFDLLVTDPRTGLVTGFVNLAAYQLVGSTWRSVPSPARVTDASVVALDRARARTLVLEGSAGALYAWDGEVLDRVASGAPAPSAGMAFDDAAGVALSFDADGKTCAWSDGVAACAFEPGGPTGRGGAALVYDEARAEIVMYGGAIGSYPTDETWLWNGTRWRRYEGASPPRRYRHRMTYDARRARVVLVGGHAGLVPGGDEPPPLGDHWEWDGAAWTELTPADGAPAPSARMNHGLAYDATLQRVVLFGGDSGPSNLGDTWTWDGAAWTRLVPLTTPPPMIARLAPDPHGGLVAFSGSTVWRLRYEAPAAASERCAYAAADDDGDGLASCKDPDCTAHCARCGNALCDSDREFLLCPADCP